LILVLPLLTVLLYFPKLSNIVWFVDLGGWRRCRLSLNLLLRPLGESWGSFILREQIGGVLWEFRDGNQTGKVSKVGALVVKFDETIMLSIVSSPQWL
jgi:hypothetical protein